MKRKWLYIGVGIAAVLQTFIHWLWVEVFFKDSYAFLQSNQFTSAGIAVIFLSKIAFALVMGFFYLHVPNEKRSLSAGSTIGSILGLLIGLYQFLDWYGTYNVTLSIIALELLKTVLLGAICGVTISFAELRTNPRSKAAGS